jgi:hypothetical protein
MTFRFAVGLPDGPRSSSWRLWSQGDEAYLLQRGISANKVKFSFHKTGNCRWAQINHKKSGRERAIIEWDRGELKSGYATPLVSLVFPTNHLSSLRKKIKETETTWFIPAKAGNAVSFEVFLSKDPLPQAQTSLGNSKKIVYSTFLRNGANLFVTISDFKCGPINLKMPAEPRMSGQVFGDLVFPDIDIKKTGRPIRMVVVGDKNVPPQAWELGGYKDY